MSELKPCPFCGKPPESEDFTLHGDYCFTVIRCVYKWCGGARIQVADREQCVKQWNTRSPNPPPADSNQQAEDDG